LLIFIFIYLSSEFKNRENNLFIKRNRKTNIIFNIE
jgi:hypothetical protein